MRGLTVAVSGRPVIAELSCRFDAPGTVIVGPPGSGKTTLLKALCGLVPWAGDVAIEGAPLPREPARLARAREVFGFVFQSDALFDDRTALANVAFPLLRRGLPTVEANAAARATLDAVGLGSAAERLPEELSGGMRKRLGIARAMVARPRFLLADDPLAGLDPGTSRRIVDLLVGSRATLVAVASDPGPFAACCPNLIGLSRGGRLALSGRTRDLLNSSDLARLYLEAEAAA